ncbi:MAG TPA: hypothetical protein VEV82_05505 [Actinomycetota bacterium]|nr:hypothetical protein [Actinomycetota bacterium]
MRKLTRNIAVVASIAVLTGALVGGTSAQAAKKCGKFKPGTPASGSESRDAAKSAKVQKVTDKNTSKKPLTIEYAHGPAQWLISDPSGETPQGQRPIVEDTKWFNIQVDSKKKLVGLYIRQEWAPTPVSDMDLYLWDKFGGLAGTSGDFNQVQGTPLNSNTGGPGWEEISGLGVTDCTGFTVESRAFSSPGEAMTLKIWIGPIK